jgi:hypothetical protein
VRALQRVSQGRGRPGDRLTKALLYGDVTQSPALCFEILTIPAHEVLGATAIPAWKYAAGIRALQSTAR